MLFSYTHVSRLSVNLQFANGFIDLIATLWMATYVETLLDFFIIGMVFTGPLNYPKDVSHILTKFYSEFTRGSRFYPNEKCSYFLYFKTNVFIYIKGF